jgi:hypothetical protein
VIKYRILQGCPRCGKFPVTLSHRRGLVDRLRAWLTGTSPYRCRACQWRGWANGSWDRRQRQTEDGQRLARRAEDREERSS